MVQVVVWVVEQDLSNIQTIRSELILSRPSNQPYLFTTKGCLGVILVQDVQITQLHPCFLENQFFFQSRFFFSKKSHLIRHEDLQVLVEFSHGAGAVALGLEDGNLPFSSTGVGLVFFDYCIQHLHRIIPPGQQQTKLEMLLGTCEVKTYFSIISIFMAIRRFILRLLGPNCSDNSWHN